MRTGKVVANSSRFPSRAHSCSLPRAGTFSLSLDRAPCKCCQRPTHLERHFWKDYPEPHYSNNWIFNLSTDIFVMTLLRRSPWSSSQLLFSQRGTKGRGAEQKMHPLQTSPAPCGANTHVFWWARWMQLKRCPFSGSVLYMVGYCENNGILWIKWSRAAFSVELQSTLKIIYPQASSTSPLTDDHFLLQYLQWQGSQLSEADSMYLLKSSPKNVRLCHSCTREGGSTCQTPSVPLTLSHDCWIPDASQRHHRETAPSQELSDTTTF